MAKISRALLLIALVLAICVSVVQNFILPNDELDNIAQIQHLENGQAVVALYQDNDIRLDLIDRSGTILNSVVFPGKTGEKVVSVAAMAADSEKNVYVLKDYLNELTGKRLYQELSVYNLGRSLFTNVQNHSLENKEGIRYRWISVSSTVNLMGTNADETNLIRSS